LFFFFPPSPTRILARSEVGAARRPGPRDLRLYVNTPSSYVPLSHSVKPQPTPILPVFSSFAPGVPGANNALVLVGITMRLPCSFSPFFPLILTPIESHKFTVFSGNKLPGTPLACPSCARARCYSSPISPQRVALVLFQNLLSARAQGNFMRQTLHHSPFLLFLHPHPISFNASPSQWRLQRSFLLPGPPIPDQVSPLPGINCGP